MTTLRIMALLFVGGILLAILLMEKMAKLQGFTPKEWDKLTLYALLGIVLGARLGHCLFYEPGYFLAHPVEIFLPIQRMADGEYHFTGFQGLASHGGALGLILAIALFTYQTKRKIFVTLDLVAVVTPIAAFFIRMANLMNSEIIGKPTDVPWAFIFEKVDMQPRHPSQLYEGISYLSIFIINILLYRKYKDRIGTGFFFGLTIALIFIARFFIEFLKERQVAFEESMTMDMGQWLSVPFVLIGAYLVWRSLKQKK